MDVDKSLNSHLFSDMKPVGFDDVLLDFCADSSRDVINKCGEMLGLSPDLVKSLFDRDKRTGSYVGDGFGIVHVGQESRHLVRDSRLAFIRLCDDVKWEEASSKWGDVTMRCVVAVSSNNNSHSNILAGVGRVLTDPDAREFLKTSDDVDKIIDLFS